MKLFDAIDRDNATAPRHRREEFRFLNSSSLAIVEHIRELFEEAFSNFSGNKADVRGRFQSPINSAHNAAAFELLLHEILRKRGLKPRPAILEGGQTPDFEIDLPEGGTAIVEAKMLQDGESIFVNDVLDMIDTVERADMQLDVRIRGALSNVVSKQKLLSTLNAHLDSIDLDAFAGPEWKYGRKRFIYPAPGGEIEIIPTYKRGYPRGLGVLHIRPVEMASETEILAGLKAKKNKYRACGKPYVIALCSGKRFASERMFADSLLRTLPGQSDDVQGIWTKPSGRHVSGVLACYSFKAAALSGAKLQLFLPPEKLDFPLPDNPFGCETVQKIENQLVRESGQPFHALVGRTAEWLDAD